MNPRLELAGQRFGRLLVLAPAGCLKRVSLWLCACDCGAVKTLRGYQLKAGRIRSCGCLRVDVQSARVRPHKVRASPCALAVCLGYP